MDQNERQRPLGLRFRQKTLWPALRRELGVSETGAAIILDIAAADGWVSYSRTARTYDRPARYAFPLYTYRRVVGAVDHLDALGLIHHARQAPGVRGWRSAMCATAELRELVADIRAGDPLRLRKPGELIILRDEDRRLIDYPETRETRRQRRNVEAMNEAIDGAGLDDAIRAPLARVFNQSLGRGGRFYAMGASWQNMKAEARKAITIDGEPAVELDFKTLHPAVLYAEAGAPLPADCYALDGWPRDKVKKALLVLINARSEPAARKWLACNVMDDPGSQDALRAADGLIQALKRRHAPIASAFHSDAGARLMAIDAGISEAVMLDMLAQGVVVLPVHDSFLVPASKRDRLEAAMLEAAHKAGLSAVKVAEK